jgi:hypothetical protein
MKQRRDYRGKSNQAILRGESNRQGAEPLSTNCYNLKLSALFIALASVAKGETDTDRHETKWRN